MLHAHTVCSSTGLRCMIMTVDPRDDPVIQLQPIPANQGLGNYVNTHMDDIKIPHTYFSVVCCFFFFVLVGRHGYTARSDQPRVITTCVCEARSSTCLPKTPALKSLHHPLHPNIYNNIITLQRLLYVQPSMSFA
jgi:hypothetical protein